MRRDNLKKVKPNNPTVKRTDIEKRMMARVFLISGLLDGAKLLVSCGSEGAVPAVGTGEAADAGGGLP
jgi:hypothetical protein